MKPRLTGQFNLSLQFVRETLARFPRNVCNCSIGESSVSFRDVARHAIRLRACICIRSPKVSDFGKLFVCVHRPDAPDSIAFCHTINSR